MGLFSKKKEKKVEEKIPSLAELPKLPELGSPENSKEEFHQLPSFPSNSLGKKFSQNSIKEAVKGEEPDFESFNPEEIIEGSLKKPQIREIEDEVEIEEAERPRREGTKKRTVVGAEPIFIRIDKFEDAMKIFDKTKRQLSDIEHLLESVKRTKDDEEEEIKKWESNLKNMRSQVEKVDRDIFSKI